MPKRNREASLIPRAKEIIYKYGTVYKFSRLATSMLVIISHTYVHKYINTQSYTHAYTQSQIHVHIHAHTTKQTTQRINLKFYAFTKQLHDFEYERLTFIYLLSADCHMKVSTYFYRRRICELICSADHCLLPGILLGSQTVSTYYSTLVERASRANSQSGLESISQGYLEDEWTCERKNVYEE